MPKFIEVGPMPESAVGEQHRSGPVFPALKVVIFAQYLGAALAVLAAIQDGVFPPLVRGALVIGGVLLVAHAEMLRVLLRIEENTSRTAERLEEISFEATDEN
jgi:hypothetical protein